MRFSTEMTRSSCARGIGVPLVHGEFGVTALDREPVIWIIGDPAANFTTILQKGCHAVHFV